MLKITGWTVGPYAENPYLLTCAETNRAVLIDPGDDASLLLQAITDAGIMVEAVLLTHAHLDHVAALTAVREALDAPVYLHPNDAKLLQQAPVYWQAFAGRQIDPIAPAEYTLDDGMQIRFGTCELQVIHTPGHTQGSVCFYSQADATLIAGDTLFNEGVGRTDLPGGDGATLLRSIQERLWPLPDIIKAYPGHGPTTTIGHERRHNPFVSQRTAKVGRR